MGESCQGLQSRMERSQIAVVLLTWGFPKPGKRTPFARGHPKTIALRWELVSALTAPVGLRIALCWGLGTSFACRLSGTDRHQPWNKLLLDWWHQPSQAPRVMAWLERGPSLVAHTAWGEGPLLGMLELAGSWDKALGGHIWQQSRGAGCGWGRLWSLLRLSPVFFHECGWQGGAFCLGGRIGNTPRPQAIGNCWRWSGTGWVLCPPPPPQAQGLGYF